MKPAGEKSDNNGQRMSLLETLYENRKRLEEDKQYFSQAFSTQGECTLRKGELLFSSVE